MEMSDNGNMIPQVSCILTTGFDRVKASVASACPADSGEGKLSQGEREDETKNPFKRRNVLLRTPPRPRTGSLPDLNEILKASQQSKRKKNEKEESPENRLDGDTRNKDDLKVTLDSISAYVRLLEKILGEIYKPKQELKEVTGKLLLEIEKLESKELSEWVSIDPTGTSNQELVSLRDEIADLRKQNHDYKDAQCDRCKEEKRKIIRRRQLNMDDSESFTKITEDDWRDEILPRIRLQQDKI